MPRIQRSCAKVKDNGQKGLSAKNKADTIEKTAAKEKEHDRREQENRERAKENEQGRDLARVGGHGDNIRPSNDGRTERENTGRGRAKEEMVSFVTGAAAEGKRVVSVSETSAYRYKEVESGKATKEKSYL